MIKLINVYFKVINIWYIYLMKRLGMYRYKVKKRKGVKW